MSSPDTYYVRGRNQYKRRRLSPRSKVARAENRAHGSLEVAGQDVTTDKAIVTTKRFIQSPSEQRQTAEKDAYCRLVEEAADRECRLLTALDEGKAREEEGKAREEEGKAREVQLLNILHANQVQHDETRTQLQELQRLLTELGIIGPRVARDTGKQYALLLRDEQAFLEEVASGIMREPESKKEKEARLRQEARDWNKKGGPAQDIEHNFPGVYDIFGKKGMAFLALEGTDEYMRAASNTLHGSATFTTPTLSAFTLEAASEKMSKHPDLIEGMKIVHAAYTQPQFMILPSTKEELARTDLE